MSAAPAVKTQAAAPVCSDQIEEWLTTREVKFLPAKMIPIEQIDETRSRANQARADAIVPDTVDRYAQAMRNGDTFPPLVVYRYGKAYTVVDGNHRHAASRRAGVKQVSVYEIDKATPVETVELLTAEANTKHGDPTSVDWRMRQAVYLLSLGHSEPLVASALGLSHSAVSKSIRLGKAEERATSLGIKGWNDLNVTSRDRLASIPIDTVLIEAARMVAEGLVTTSDINDVVRDLKGVGSEKEGLQYLADLRSEREFEREHRERQKQAKRSIANPKMQVLAALGAVRKIDPQSVLRLFISDDERLEVARRCGDASVVLMELEDVLKKGLPDAH